MTSIKDLEMDYEKETEAALQAALDDAIEYGTGFVTIDRGLNFKHVSLD